VLAKLRSYRPSHAVVVAYLALFVALGGSSYAAITITGKNVKNSSLTGKDVKNNSLTGSDVKNIKSGDVSDHSLLAKDFKPGQLPQGAAGKPGVPGEPGKDATKLFGYIREYINADTTTANLEYGRGVTGVDDPSGNNAYTVSFDRSIQNCVVLALTGPGSPNPNGSAYYPDGIPSVTILGEPNTNKALIEFQHGSPPSTVDTAFQVAAFC
jgi:hypothetical protein